MTKTEHLSDSVTLHLGDCRDVLPTLAARADAVVSDPPYGIGWNADTTRFSGGTGRTARGKVNSAVVSDDVAFDPAPWISFPECILFGFNNYCTDQMRGSVLIWLKKEPSAFGSFLSDAELAWKKGGHGIYARLKPWGNLASAAESIGCDTHPTQKPIEIMPIRLTQTDAEGHSMLITDEMCRRAIEAMKPDRIQGFSTPHDSPNGLNRTWGAPHYVRDVFVRPEMQELWRGDSDDEMMERCEIERMRLALMAALQDVGPSASGG